MARKTFVETLATTLDRVSAGKVAALFREAATTTDDDPRASEYRRLTGTKRDLPPLTIERQRELSAYVWQRNPVGSRMVEIVTDFCTGDDFDVKVKIMRRGPDGKEVDTGRNEAQEIFRKFNDDPVNRFTEDMGLFLQDFLVFGELCIPATVARGPEDPDGNFSGDGSVRIGYIDSSNVTEAVPNPENVRVIETVMLRARSSSGDPMPRKVITIDTDPNSPTYNRRVGDVFFFRYNRLVNQTRGTGMLADILDWLDLLDQFLFDALRGFQVRNTFFWSVMMKGLTDAQIKERQKDFKPPTIGAARLHNENVEYEAKAPELGSIDVERALVSMQTFVVGSKGYPVMWFGNGAETNKATAGEMATPTMAMLKRVQGRVRDFVREIVLYICDQAAIAGTLKLAADEYITVEISMYDFERRDAAEIGTGFASLMTAIVSAITEGLVSPESAKKLVDGLLRRMGVEIPDDETVESLRAKRKQEREESAYDGAPPFPGKGNGQAPPFGKGKGNGVPAEESDEAEE